MELPFATLEPANALAKMAFSDEYDTILRDQQNNTANDVLPTDCFQVASEQRYDPEVLRYHREMTKQSEADFSESATELDTDTEIDAGDLGTVWTGCYVLQLENAPSQPNMGWIAGKGPYADISLCTKAFAKRHNLNIRSFHARFNFDVRNGAFFIVSITSSPLAGLGVNGISVTRQLYVLNQHNMKVRVGLLEYNFKYTEYASSDEFMRRRGEYLITKLRALNSVVFDMPTPRRNTRTIGQWTLGDPLGKGNTGRVFLATNTKNETVAVKIMELNSTSKRSVDNEIAICRALTALAKNHDNGERIVRLKETIDPREEATRASCVFDEVGIVLEPMTPMTLSDLIGERTSGGRRGMSLEAAAVFRDALLGLQVMHKNEWVHRDLKPANIGVMSTGAVLLDVGHAKFLKRGRKLKATPGGNGTINYLAPERELSEYDQSADIWAMGCIGFELTYGYHPFKFAANPWRCGREYEQMRQPFQMRYNEAMDELSTHYRRFASQPDADKSPYFVHLGDLLVQMLRHPLAERLSDREQRIDIDKALQHPAWKPLLSDLPQDKRPKIGKGARR